MWRLYTYRLLGFKSEYASLSRLSFSAGIHVGPHRLHGVVAGCRVGWSEALRPNDTVELQDLGSQSTESVKQMQRHCEH